MTVEDVDKAFLKKYPTGYSKENLNFPTDNFDDLALINYTSGSTGNPKGVMVTHRNLSSNVVFGQDKIPNDPSKSIVSMLPMAHMFGLMFEFIYQLAGGTHVYFIVKSLTPSLLMQAFKDVHPYMILTVPLLVEKIFKKQIFPVINKPLVKALWYTPLVNIPIRKKVYNQLMQAFGGKLEVLIIGGAALNEEVERCMRQIKFPYTVGYGMTECAPLVCYEHWSKYAFRSCGKGIDRLEIRVDSPNPRKIEVEIMGRMGRGVTKINGNGAFTGENVTKGDVAIDGSDTDEGITYLTRSNFAGTFPTPRAARSMSSKMPNDGWLPTDSDTTVMPTQGKKGDLRLYNDDGTLNEDENACLKYNKVGKFMINILDIQQESPERNTFCNCSLQRL